MSRRAHDQKQSNPNYRERKERPSRSGASYGPIEYRVDPPLPPPHRHREDTSGIREVSSWRKQLVILAVDDSGSMEYDGKCEAASEATQEMIYRMKIRSPERAHFDAAVFYFGTKRWLNTGHMLRPVTEIDEDQFRFYGDSGRTKIREAMIEICRLLDVYERGYYRLHKLPHMVPPPLVILLSDGCDRDIDPRDIAQKMANTELAIGLKPIIVTVGVETNDERLDVGLLQDIASKTEAGNPLYYHITRVYELAELLATAGSSAATTPDELYRTNQRLFRDNKGLLPGPQR